MNGHPRRSIGTRIKIGHDDPTLTGHAGLLLTGELVRRLEVMETIEEAVDRVRPFKRRRRGLNAGELMVSLAETVMVGGNHLVHLDQLRGDLAGAELRAVAVPPAPTTAGQLLKRFGVGQCRAVVVAMAELGNRFDRQMGLPVSTPVTLDMDGSLSEVYGRLKEMASFNHEGRRGFLSVFVTWDERRRILAAGLLKGSASEKPGAAGLLRRALRTLPAGHGPVSLRVDSGFYTVELLEACRRQRVEFCVSVARTEAMWTRLYAKLNVKSWRPALDMEDAEVAEFAYTPPAGSTNRCGPSSAGSGSRPRRSIEARAWPERRRTGTLRIATMRLPTPNNVATKEHLSGECIVAHRPGQFRREGPGRQRRPRSARHAR